MILKFRLGKKFSILLVFYETLQHYVSKRVVLIKAFFYSVVIYLLLILSIYVLSLGLSINISFISFMGLFPVIILISIIPVSVSGIGLREGAFVYFLGNMGVPPGSALTLSLLWFLSMVTAGLYGLFEYLRLKTWPYKDGVPERQITV